MTKKELKALKDGTLIYNGRTEGIIKTVDGMKMIEILIPIVSMSNDSSDFDDCPKYWDVLED